MQKVTTHVGLDVHAERIVLASLVGQQYGVPLAEVDTPRVDKRGTDRVEGCS